MSVPNIDHAPPSPEDEARYAVIRADLQSAIRRVCPRWLRDRQDDLVQCAVLRVMDVERKREGKADLGSSYLYRVAYSAMIDEIRRIKRRHETNLEDDEQDRPTVYEMHTERSPEEMAQVAQHGEAIRECVQALAPARRAAVTLYLVGHTVPQSARLLEWTLKKTENLVYRGLADLRQCLLGKGIRP